MLDLVAAGASAPRIICDYRIGQSRSGRRFSAVQSSKPGTATLVEKIFQNAEEVDSFSAGSLKGDEYKISVSSQRIEDPSGCMTFNVKLERLASSEHLAETGDTKVCKLIVRCA
jgi:hypothetical protein